MKNLSILVAIILFSSCVTSQVTATEFESIPSLGDEKFLWWWHYQPFNPFFHPQPPQWPFPGKALPPLPAGFHPPQWPFPGKALPPLPPIFHPPPFHPPPVVTKCLSDCKDVRTCVADIAKAFFTQKPDVGLNCCSSILKMDDDCQKTIFGAYHNPFFDCMVKIHCSSKTKPTPCSPSPA